MKYLLIPLEDTVVFPNMTATLPLDTGTESRVLLVPRHEGVYAKVGTVAEVVESGRLPGGGSAVTLTGLHRAVECERVADRVALAGAPRATAT